MIKSKDLIGKKVISKSDGKEIHSIKDVVYDPKQQMIIAFILEDEGIFSDAKILPFENIESVGKDAVLIANKNAVKKRSEAGTQVQDAVKNGGYLTTTKIVTEEGANLGRVSDVYFEPTTGVVQELEVSQGLKNIESGKKTVKVSDIITVGEDVTIVKGATEGFVKSQETDRGLRGFVNKAMDTVEQKAPDVVENVKQKSRSVAKDAKDKIEEVKRSPRTQEIYNSAQADLERTGKDLQRKFKKAKKDLQSRRVSEQPEDYPYQGRAGGRVVINAENVTIESEPEDVDTTMPRPQDSTPKAKKR